ncbi:hypothetical protein BAUCODRAFT_151826 [Baudoinia panamericana UAMH 10762]|uniref:RRM domain-containing protein n=1 Tax=Baudoinia panamericana (strain UAMH 10762) TaxID=717646 RepID=M2MM31_BAUPA|nr:uncharacterized protein BAUCODRAFT_151826 [Baudoinia panamericana UAMH 10762]EMC92433.1 hypothetical protein BAUCODRAFT_151826 [Baudoinia panamericana UAMH 10762]
MATIMDDTDTPSSVEASPPPSGGEKRKRPADDIPEDEKLEVDITAPEPPSKKAKRLEKKREKRSSKSKNTPVNEGIKALVKEYFEGSILQTASPRELAAKRGEYGIWIGNLPWSATKESLREFLKEQGGIEGREITRVHMPAPNAPAAGDVGVARAKNKGFAYVDFLSEGSLSKALGASEKLMAGRRVLVKNAKSFEGRPDSKPKQVEGEGARDGKVKEPARRVFVGNLGFDVTKEDLAEHFSLAGEVEDIHMATFEDSGKCKGFAWVRFKEVDAAEAAVRGYVYQKVEEGSEEESDEEEEAEKEVEQDDEDGKPKSKKTKKKTKSKRNKQHINRIHGRELRCEFAEDSQTRYKKRFGKGAATTKDRRAPAHGADTANSRISGDADDALPTGEETLEGLAGEAAAARSGDGKPRRAKQKPGKEERREERRKRHDARTVAPGQALANAQRATGAIVQGAGKKVTFD